jgi:hypothetical protein
LYNFFWNKDTASTYDNLKEKQKISGVEIMTCVFQNCEDDLLPSFVEDDPYDVVISYSLSSYFERALIIPNKEIVELSRRFFKTVTVINLKTSTP